MLATTCHNYGITCQWVRVYAIKITGRPNSSDYILKWVEYDFQDIKLEASKISEIHWYDILA